MVQHSYLWHVMGETSSFTTEGPVGIICNLLLNYS